MYDKLLKDIKKKKELENISNNFILDQIKDYFKKNPKSLQFLDKDKSYKLIIKEIRSKLRRMIGLFQVKRSKNQEKLLNNYLLNKSKNSLIELLKTHASTMERIPIYEKLYQQIFKITKKPNSILDLGCGLNPISYPLMNLKNVTYNAYDISLNDLNIIKKFFKELKIKGKIKEFNLLKITKKSFPKSNLAFLFKITDILDQGKGHKTTEKVITTLPVNWIILSFPTKTMSGKIMTAPRRSWVELLCKRLNYEYKIIEFENEIFYIIKKN